MGTFAGVFTPSILTILGLILFLRLGFVVGNAGLGRALLIVGMANAISVLTSLSLAAIATNLIVKGGGDYYIISRTLGLEFGGAIGIVLFLAQSVSVGFYCIGFGEIASSMLPWRVPLAAVWMGGGAVAVLFPLAWLGSDWATRFQFVVMAVLAAALASFLAGAVPAWSGARLGANWGPLPGGLPFWSLFALFFPAVTGFTQGVSMSGELQDPGRSIPAGTFSAVLLSAAIYLLLAILFAAAAPRDVLCQDYEAMKRLSRVGSLIDLGVVAATLSSAMASFLGGPRILQSLARDRIFPFLTPFQRGAGPASNPRRAVLLTTGIAGGTVALGNLNLVAPVVSMFFLISYGLINYATFFESRSASPSFRPRFRLFHGHLSLLGALVCLGVMLAIDPSACLISIALLASVHQYLRRTAGPSRWADSRRSYHMHQAREHLLAADREPDHPRDWRPQLLVCSGSPEQREPLLQFARWVAGTSGITTALRILEGVGTAVQEAKEAEEKALREQRDRLYPTAFPLVVVARHAGDGLVTLAQAVGTGPLRTNTILSHWRDPLPGLPRSRERTEHARNLETLHHAGCNVITLAEAPDSWKALLQMPRPRRRIDVWWQDDATSRLMLLLAHLMKRSEMWEAARIRVLAAGALGPYEQALARLRDTLKEVRISAEPEVATLADAGAIRELSTNAALVFLPFRFRGRQFTGPFGTPLEPLLPHLPATALCLAAGDMELDADPETGKAGKRGEALNALEDAEKQAREAEKEAARESAAADEAFRTLVEAGRSGARGGPLEEMETAVMEAQFRARRAIRRSARLETRVEDARAELEALGGPPAPGKDAAAASQPPDREVEG